MLKFVERALRTIIEICFWVVEAGFIFGMAYFFDNMNLNWFLGVVVGAVAGVVANALWGGLFALLLNIAEGVNRINEKMGAFSGGVAAGRAGGNLTGCFCEKCGAALGANEQFCPACGAER
jgi:hypothetical protein